MKHVWRTLHLILVNFGVPAALVTACPVLQSAGTMPITVSNERVACAEIVVIPGLAAQLEVNYDRDLAFYLTGGATLRVQDGFEFGRETLTIGTPGAYRVEIRFASSPPSDHSQLTLTLSWRTFSPDVARNWETAEQSATNSKRSKDVRDILTSLDFWRRIGDSSAIARTQLKMGDAKLRTGGIAEARDAYRQALDLCRTIADLRCFAEAANNNGLTERQMGNFDASQALFEEAADGWRRLGSHTNEGKTLSNLGVLYSLIGDYQQAVSSFDRARHVLAGRDGLAYGRVLNNLGWCYLSLADYGKADGYFVRAIAAESGRPEAKSDIARARLNLARGVMLQGRPATAQRMMEAAVDQSAALPDRGLRGFALNNLGQTLWRQNQFEAAQGRLTEALAIHRALGDRRWEAIALFWLGQIARSRHEPERARELLGLSLRIRRDVGLRDDEADSLQALAELEWAAGNADLAADLAGKAIPLLESIRSLVPSPALRASFFARRRSLFDLLVTIAMRPDNPDAVGDGFLAAEQSRGRALVDVITERRSSTLPSGLMERRRAIRHELDLLPFRASMSANPDQNLHSSAEALIAEDEEIEARIMEYMAREEPGLRRAKSLADLQRDSLPEDSAILEFHLGESSSHLWLIERSEVRAFALPPRAAIDSRAVQLNELLGQFTERMRDPARQARFKRSLAELSRTLLEPLRNTALPSRLILVLDGNLQRIPFAALRLPDGQYLGTSHDLIMMPSAAYLTQARAPRAISDFPYAVLALSDPVFSADDPRVQQTPQRPQSGQSSQFARLPFSAELDTINRLVPGTRRRSLRGFDASASALSSLPGGQFAILHLSTHAVIDDRVPELSRIVLSMVDRQGHSVNGYLLPNQLAGLNLRDSIVVLSACETALGKEVLGEGLMGFTTSLFSAGASQLVLTLSPVDAEASSVFLSEAYRHVFDREAAGMEHALTLARRSLVRSPRWSDPYYWASFVIAGVPAESKKAGSGSSPHVPESSHAQ